MASGNLRDNAQIPAECQFCNSSDIKVKCLHCKGFLCQPCLTGVHSKIRNSQDHQLVNLGDVGSKENAESYRRFDLGNLTCDLHEGQRCLSYCNDCTKPICLKCIRETCQKHSIADIEETYDLKYSTVKDLCGRIDNDIPFFVNAKIQLQKSLVERGQQSDELKENIRQQEEKQKAEVSRLSQDLLNKVDQIYQPTEVKIKEEMKKVQRNEEQLQKRKEKLDKILHSYHAGDVLSGFNVKDEELPNKVVSDITMTHAKFCSSDMKSISFGKICKIPELNLVKSYQTNLINITNIEHAHNDNNMKFIASFADKKLQIVKIENEKLNITREENIKVEDMAQLNNGDLIISSANTELKLYTKSGTLQTYKTFSPFVTLGVHVNKDNEVFVGLIESLSNTITKDSVRQVLVLNQSGDIQHRFEFDKNNQRLFTQPDQIVTCGNSVCVVDILNGSEKGRVVVIDYRGDIKWVYNGCGSGKDKQKFYPKGMAVTSTNMILVSDDENHAIHVLTSTGEVIVCHNVRDMGIELPYSLSIDPSGLLWVGCNFWVKDKHATAKLHVIKL